MYVRLICSFAVLLLAGSPALNAQDAKKGPPTAVLSGGPQVGKQAPDFTLPWANKDGIGPADSPYQLWRDRGKTVVIAFYPRDFTRGCTAQMQTFADQYDTLFGPDVVVVGINTDSLTTHSRFAGAAGSAFPAAHRCGSEDRPEVRQQRRQRVSQADACSWWVRTARWRTGT